MNCPSDLYLKLALDAFWSQISSQAKTGANLGQNLACTETHGLKALPDPIIYYWS